MKICRMPHKNRKNLLNPEETAADSAVICRKCHEDAPERADTVTERIPAAGILQNGRPCLYL